MEELRLSDEFLNVEEEEKETWKVQDDLAADWVLDKIRESKAEYSRFEMIAKAKIEQIKDRLEKEKKKMKDEVGFFESKLREYFETVKAKETKTQKSYNLPSGKLKLKKSKATFDYKKDKLLDMAKEQKLEDLIKVKEDFDWAEFKKQLKIDGDKIINKETGEVLSIEGLGIKHKPEEFKVEV
ncbi:host-nuclease inhibitor Gam family protein [Dethiothermospora halolimnae]|uniref:host-nuclease inhibitor Gam family protein n=1 Tax=Dethiothermospora halolimnae TaxID=3114390 RepID=UPI003CCB86BD